jgi:hypothetical protein
MVQLNLGENEHVFFENTEIKAKATKNNRFHLVMTSVQCFAIIPALVGNDYFLSFSHICWAISKGECY